MIRKLPYRRDRGAGFKVGGGGLEGTFAFCANGMGSRNIFEFLQNLISCILKDVYNKKVRQTTVFSLTQYLIIQFIKKS